MVERAEIITKSEAARRWKVSSAAVSKYCLRGMPLRSDGRLDWPEVDEWRKRFNAPSRSGNHLSRLQVDTNPGARTQEFQAGAAWLAEHLRTVARTSWPSFVASADFSRLAEPTGIGCRIIFTTLFLFLMDEWTKDFPASARSAVDWTVFGDDCEAEECEGLFEYWKKLLEGRI